MKLEDLKAGMKLIDKITNQQILIVYAETKKDIVNRVKVSLQTSYNETLSISFFDKNTMYSPGFWASIKDCSDAFPIDNWEPVYTVEGFEV